MKRRLPIHRLLMRITANRPARLIKLGDQPYLERYYMGRLFGRYWYLHRFVRDDNERHVHDHPWRSAISFVLCGGYVEARTLLASSGAGSWAPPRISYPIVWWLNRVQRKPGRIDLHRIMAVVPETWTLFGHTEWEHPWGFYQIKPSS